jgi:hypothetical protein
MAMVGALTTPSHGLALQDWLTGWCDGDPTWASVEP